MPIFVPAIAEHFKAHCGVASRTNLMGLGLTPEMMRTLLRSGELVRMYDGVYRSALWPDALEPRCAAMCATDERVVICCGGASELWQYRQTIDVGVHVTTTAAGRPFEGAVVHRCSVMPASRAQPGRSLICRDMSTSSRSRA
jgi:hypothetical protein